MKAIQEYALTIWWIKNLAIVSFRHAQKRFFIFRDQPNGFLKYVEASINRRPEKHKDPRLVGMYQQALDEIEARKRRGEWSA